MGMSSIIGEILKKNRQQLQVIGQVRAKVSQGKKAIDRLEKNCDSREKVIQESNKKNIELLMKLQTVVKEKQGFDDELHQNLKGIYHNLKTEVQPKAKKNRISDSIVFLISEEITHSSNK